MGLLNDEPGDDAPLRQVRLLTIGAMIGAVLLVTSFVVDLTGLADPEVPRLPSLPTAPADRPGRFPSEFPTDFPTGFPTDLPTGFPMDLPTLPPLPTLPSLPTLPPFPGGGR